MKGVEAGTEGVVVVAPPGLGVGRAVICAGALEEALLDIIDSESLLFTLPSM